MPVLIDSDGRILRAPARRAVPTAPRRAVPPDGGAQVRRRVVMNRIRYYWDGLIAVIFLVWVVGLIVGAAIGTWIR